MLPARGWAGGRQLPLPRSLGPRAASHSSFQKLLQSLLGWAVLLAPPISGVSTSPLGVCGLLPAAQGFLEGRTALLVTCSGQKPQPLPARRCEGQNATRTGISRSPFRPHVTSAGWVRSPTRLSRRPGSELRERGPHSTWCRSELVYSGVLAAGPLAEGPPWWHRLGSP